MISRPAKPIFLLVALLSAAHYPFALGQDLTPAQLKQQEALEAAAAAKSQAQQRLCPDFGPDPLVECRTPTTYDELRDTIEEAESGDVLELCPFFISKISTAPPITVRSGVTVKCMQRRPDEWCIIQGGGKHLVIATSEDTVFQGFSFRKSDDHAVHVISDGVTNSNQATHTFCQSSWMETLRNEDTRGGALMLDRNAGTVNLVQSLFSENYSKTFGAGVYTRTNQLNIIESIFVRNTAPGFGGAIFAASGANLMMEGTSFISNRGRNGHDVVMNPSEGTETFVDGFDNTIRRGFGNGIVCQGVFDMATDDCTPFGEATDRPTQYPSDSPSAVEVEEAETEVPTISPTTSPTARPSEAVATASPVSSPAPTVAETAPPTQSPSTTSSDAPTEAPTSMATTKATTPSIQCGCDTCTDEIWDTMAGNYTCGERITWLKTATPAELQTAGIRIGFFSHARACQYVGEEFPDICLCNPKTCGENSGPSPSAAPTILSPPTKLPTVNPTVAVTTLSPIDEDMPNPTLPPSKETLSITERPTIGSNVGNGAADDNIEKNELCQFDLFTGGSCLEVQSFRSFKTAIEESSNQDVVFCGGFQIRKKSNEAPVVIQGDMDIRCLERCTLFGEGSFMIMGGSLSQIRIDNMRFMNANSTAIQVQTGSSLATTTFCFSEFSSNTAEPGQNGGAIAISARSGVVNVVETQFTNNQGAQGGAICHEGNLMNVISSRFTVNRAKILGNAIFIGEGSHILVRDSQFILNTAEARSDVPAASNNYAIVVEPSRSIRTSSRPGRQEDDGENSMVMSGDCSGFYVLSTSTCKEFS